MGWLNISRICIAYCVYIQITRTIPKLISHKQHKIKDICKDFSHNLKVNNFLKKGKLATM